MRSILVYTVLSVALSLVFSLQPGPSPQKELPLQISTVQINILHQDQSLIHRYGLPLSRLPSTAETVLGLSTMNWMGSTSKKGVKGWRSHIQGAGSTRQLLIILSEKLQNWIMSFTVLTLLPMKAIEVYSGLEHVSERVLSSEGYLLHFNRGSGDVQHEKLVAERGRQYEGKIEIMLNGVDFDEEGINQVGVEIDLGDLLQNSTHIILRRSLKGVKKIYYSLILINEQKLLQDQFYISSAMADPLLSFYLLSSFKLNHDDSGQNISESHLLSVVPITCSQFWHPRIKKCLSSCSSPYLSLKSLKICTQNYQQPGRSLQSTVTCPANITNCVTCQTNVGSSTVICATCANGYYKTTSSLCSVCPIGCPTCIEYQTTPPHVHCFSCYPTFTLQADRPHQCICSPGTYAQSGNPPSCVPCTVGCATCTSATVCTSCSQGYYLSSTSCLPCMPVCKTCSGATTCSSCISTTMTFSGSSCTCPSPKLLTTTTSPISCISCSTFDSHCLTCAYNPPVYSPSAPNPIVCSVPALTYYVLGNGSTASCGAYCNVCTNAVTCNVGGCFSTFTEVGGVCQCVAPLALTNVAPFYCQNCAVVISGCSSCQTTTVTQCALCLNAYYPSTAYPTASCLPCPLTCATCTDPLTCGTCNLPFILNGNDTLCLCDNTTSTYVDPTQTTCAACNTIVLNCFSCNAALPTTCDTCDPGYSKSADGLQCIACPLNCDICSSTTVCTTCEPGFNWNGTDCDCDATCQACLNSTGGACSSCVYNVPIDCYGCAAGWYLVGLTCQPCLAECLACGNGGSCISCLAPFILNATKLCVCNNTAGEYLTLDNSTCLTCGNVIALCTSCSNTGIPSTVCNSCVGGFYVDPLQTSCLPCTFPCNTCTINDTYCLSCFVTYTYDSTNHLCICDDLANPPMFYSPLTLGCLVCASIIPNCASCAINGTNSTITDCLVCDDPYYIDSTTNTCLLCDLKCTSCTGVGMCVTCATNLIPMLGACVCDTWTDPLLTYYAGTNICVSCLGLLSNCLSCTPSPTLTCLSCAAGTYPSGGVCVLCPSQCATCNAAGCTGCPLGTTLSLSNTCTCDTTCLSCHVSALNCQSCVFDAAGVLTLCNSCVGGYEVTSDGLSCKSCPSGCATCSAGACLTCVDTFILIGITCQCEAALDLYSAYGSCMLCEDIFPGCLSCIFDGTTTDCTSCGDGFFLNGTECGFCDPSCSTCSAQTTCTGCPAGYTLSGGSCTCGPSCTNCSLNVTLCTQCILTIFNDFAQCSACPPTYYLDPTNFTCVICPLNCITCDNTGACTSCPYTQQVINGTCQCAFFKDKMMNNLTGLCEACALAYSYCDTCQVSVNVSIGYECLVCDGGYYFSANSTCNQEMCGDGIVSPNQQCDDGNDLSDDGCFGCFIQQFYNCSGQPSICLVNTDFSLYFDSVEISTVQCNQLTLFFKITPDHDSYRTADFNLMYALHNDSRLIYLQTFEFSKGLVGFHFSYTADIVGIGLKFYFMPRLTGLSELSQVPLTLVFFKMPQPSNILTFAYQPPEVCQQKQTVNKIVDGMEYISYGILILSALPAKIVGLELFGVIQLTFLSLGSMDHLNPLHASFTKLKGSNGLTLKIDDNEPTNTRLLQSTARTTQRVQTIGYASNFLRNCNLMLILVAAVMVLAFVLYLLTYLCKNIPCLYGFARRMFKEVLLTLILFNCFNFAYSAGLHYSYADRSDSLYIWGTLAAVASMVVPFMMLFLLQCTEEDGFGQFKDKLKPGKVQKAYFMITILYRMGIGFYLATMNEQTLSTLLVLLLSIYFLIYNLVNLPFRKAYHNYRANICHLSQFLVLYTTMYYRAMTEGSTQSQLDAIVNPVYVELGALGLCIFVSAVVLVVDIYYWIWEVREEGGTREENRVEIVQSHKKEEQSYNQVKVETEVFVEDGSCQKIPANNAADVFCEFDY